MLGRTIEARSPVPVSAIVCLLMAAALCGWAVIERNPHPAIAAVLPGLLAIGLWLGQPPSMVVTLEGDGISKLGSMQRIPYKSIASITVEGREYCGGGPEALKRPVEISHGDQVLILPARMTAPAADLMQFLAERMVPTADRPLPEGLANFAREQQEKFGHERVDIVRARGACAETWTRRRNLAVVLALLAAGSCWFVGGIALASSARRSEDYAAWIALGVIVIVSSGVVGVILRGARLRGGNRQLAGHQQACIVIAPAGLAMSQGDMEGVLRWDQIVDATTSIPQFLRMNRVSGLRLRIQGGEVIALDVYERTPQELSQLVRSRMDGHAT